MRLQGWRAAPALFRSPQHGECPPSRRRAAKEAQGVMVAAALWHGLETPHGGAGDRGIELCKGRVLRSTTAALCQAGRWFSQ